MQQCIYSVEFLQLQLDVVVIIIQNNDLYDSS